MSRDPSLWDFGGMSRDTAVRDFGGTCHVTLRSLILGGKCHVTLRYVLLTETCHKTSRSRILADHITCSRHDHVMLSRGVLPPNNDMIAE